MFENIQSKRGLQLILGFLIGIAFGFLLQKGGVAYYDTIIGQLLLEDFTVLKIMLTATVTGMFGIYIMKDFGLVRIHPKPGSLGSTVIGSLIFGVGFAILGYCPGTVVGAAGGGFLDALWGGIPGILLGAGLFATLYPYLEERILKKGDFGTMTLPEFFKINQWRVIMTIATILLALLVGLELSGR